MSQVHTGLRIETSMFSWFRPLEVSKVIKHLVDFETVERLISYNTRGVILPFHQDDMSMNQDGQRDWRWRQLFCGLDVDLKIDDVAVIEGVRFRVMSEGDFRAYGYNYFELQEDYNGRRS